MKRTSFFMLFAILSIAVQAQTIKKVTPGIFYVSEINCSFRMAFGELAIEREDTITRSFFNQQGQVIYETLTNENPDLSAVEMGFDPNDIESVMTHDMSYSNAPSNAYTRFYRYNDKQQIESIYTFTYEGKFTQLRKFTHDKFGVSVEDIFDANNKLISKIKNNRSADGKQIEHVVYNGNGSERAKIYYELDAVGDTILLNNRFGATHFTYDKAHHLASKYIQKEHQTRYKYDNHGNCILEYPYRFGNISKSWVVGYPQVKYEYELDEKGNWTTKKTYNVQTDVMSNLEKISKRQVFYPASPEKHEKLVSDIEIRFQKHMATLQGL